MRRRLRNAIGNALGYYGCPGCGQTMWRFDRRQWTSHPMEWGPGWEFGHSDCSHCGHCPVDPLKASRVRPWSS